MEFFVSTLVGMAKIGASVGEKTVEEGAYEYHKTECVICELRAEPQEHLSVGGIIQHNAGRWQHEYNGDQDISKVNL